MDELRGSYCRRRSMSRHDGKATQEVPPPATARELAKGALDCREKAATSIRERNSPSRSPSPDLEKMGVGGGESGRKDGLCGGVRYLRGPLRCMN